MTDKKQAFRLVQSICDINENQWGNKTGSYDDKLESSYPIEEALEGYPMSTLANLLDKGFDEYANPKDVSRLIMRHSQSYSSELLDVDRFDKHLDIIYFSIGSLHKLGLTAEDMIDGLQIVHASNLSKSGSKDSEGKVTKQESFIQPEPELQKILDKRNL